MATQSDREIELSQTNRGVGGVCVGVVPRVQSKLSRALHAHRGKKLLQDLQTQESAATKRAMVRFRGAREKGAMAFVECLGVSQEDTMEGPLRRETLGRSLGSHDATELVGGMCHGNGCLQETTRLHAISCSKTGWSSLTHNRVLHQALARSLRESKVQFVVEDTWPFRQRASEENGRLNPLRMDITTEAGALFDNHPRHKNKALLLDITIVNPCAGSNLGNAVRHVGKHLADAVERKKNKYRGSFPATYSLLPLAMSTCGDVGSDVHALIKELAIRRVQHRSETYSNDSQHLAEGTEVARLRRRFSFVLQQDGDEDNGNENRIGEGGRGTKKLKKPQNSCRRRAGNGGDMGGKRKKCRKERAGSVAANSDNLGSYKEAGGGAQGAQGSSKICTSRESVSPLTRLIRGFRNKYH